MIPFWRILKAPIAKAVVVAGFGLSVLWLLPLAGLGGAPAQTPNQLLFGPKKYLRTAGPPNTYTDSIPVSPSVGAPFLLQIVNGGEGRRISAAWVELNGLQVAGPSDFAASVAVLSRAVALNATNRLSLRLASAPGASLTISLYGTALAQPVALQPDRIVLVAGATGTLTVSLSPTPTAAGALVLSSSDSQVAVVPPMAPFAAGQTSVTISVTAVAPGNAIITASGNGGSVSSAVVVGAIPPAPDTFIADFTPLGIQTFLSNNPDVITAAKFLERLRPEDFKQYWIMMTKTESAQIGDGPGAVHPRFILPHKDATKVFGLEIAGDNKEEIEYMQFDSTLNRFLFHLIDTPNRKVIKNAPGCASCHAGRPNWDAYDSWAGALPYNRDRIYQDSHEEAAVKRLLKNLRDDPIVKQLDLPDGITRDINGDVTITFDGWDPHLPIGTPADRVDVPYSKDVAGNVIFPGPTGATDTVNVNRGGPFLTMHHSGRDDTDEGRGVALFDQLTAMNAMRVAQELLDNPRNVVDIRPVALAIANSCVDGTTLGDYAPQAALDAFAVYHGMSFDGLRTDTRTRQESLPQKKADLQAVNVSGLITAISGDPDPAVEFIVSDVFRRSNKGRVVEDDDLFKPDQLTGIPTGPNAFGMVDRELYDDATLKIALFRFFLEPSKVPVKTWSMSVRTDSTSKRRNETYTFGDLFNLKYLAKIVEMLGESEMSDTSGTDKAKGKDKSCAQLAADSKDWFDKAITNNPDFFKK
jgi:hypothetical protein